MFTKTIQGRDYFAYSVHRTYDAACDALEDYFANGEICEAELPMIEPTTDRKLVSSKARWAVMFPM